VRARLHYLRTAPACICCGFASFRDARVCTYPRRLPAYHATIRAVIRTRADLVDFGGNPKVPEFGGYGLCAVRWGKASKGSPPRRHTVLTVMPWAPTVIEEYVRQVRTQYGTVLGSVMWPTGRGGRVSADHVSRRFAEYRDQLGLPAELHPHCLRHSDVTHVVEDGFDPLFVQQQVGHAWGATTALHTGVSGDVKNQALRAALDRQAAAGVANASPATVGGRR